MIKSDEHGTSVLFTIPLADLALSRKRENMGETSDHRVALLSSSQLFACEFL
jgi:hypothetical protein